MRISSGSGGKPHRDDEAAAFELDAVIRTGGKHLPVIVLFEGLKGGGDLGGLAPRHAVVLAALVKGAHVLKAEEHVHGAVLVGDEDGVVVGHVVGIHVLHLEREGVLLLRTFDIRDALRRAPCFAFIRAATQQNPDVIPIADTRSTLPCLAPREHRSLRGDDDAGDVVELIGGIFADGEEVRFLDEWLCGWK